MKSPLLVFLGLSVATHATLLTWHDVATDLPTRGQQIQVSLLSGERQVTVSASRPGDNGSSSKKSVEQEVPSAATVDQRISNGHDPNVGDKESASIASLPQQAVTPLSGEQISQEIHRLLAARFTYPPLALRQGYQGQVLVAVSIEANGKIASATLARSSGYRILDLAAVESVLAIHRVPQLQQWLRGRSISINVPVDYRLIET
jgi:TonB family protein